MSLIGSMALNFVRQWCISLPFKTCWAVAMVYFINPRVGQRHTYILSGNIWSIKYWCY